MVCKPETLNMTTFIFPDATVLDIDKSKAEGINIKKSLKDVEVLLWNTRLQMIEGLKTKDVTNQTFLENNIMKISDIINQVCELEKEFDY